MVKETRSEKTRDLVQLKKELEGVHIQDKVGNVRTYFRGLIQSVTNGVSKYHLNKFKKELDSELETYEKFREDEIKARGVEVDGAITIPPTIDDPEAKKPKRGEKPAQIPNPKLTEFLEMEKDILDSEIKLTFPIFSPEELLNFEGSEEYDKVYSLLIKEREDE